MMITQEGSDPYPSTAPVSRTENEVLEELNTEVTSCTNKYVRFMSHIHPSCLTWWKKITNVQH